MGNIKKLRQEIIEALLRNEYYVGSSEAAQVLREIANVWDD
jgi:hypothetical protein